MSGMIRVNLLKPVSSYFSCHFRTVMLLPKLSLFILLASLFLFFVRQFGHSRAVKCFVKARARATREKCVASTRLSGRIYLEYKWKYIWYIQELENCSGWKDFLANRWSASWKVLTVEKLSLSPRFKGNSPEERGLSPRRLGGFQTGGDFYHLLQKYRRHTCPFKEI